VYAEVIERRVTGGIWNAGSYWEYGFVPDAAFEDIALIPHDTGVFLTSPADYPVAGLILDGEGQMAAGGMLEIRSGGSLQCIQTQHELGAVIIGKDWGGSCNLRILNGGSLTAESLSLHAHNTLTFEGPDNYVEVKSLALSNKSMVIGRITDRYHSPLRVTGSAALAGEFRPEFVGITPVLGDSWDIIDAANIVCDYLLLDLHAAPPLPADHAYQLRRVSGGTNGQMVQLVVVEASVPYCGDEDHPYPDGDLNKDCHVDLFDFALLSDRWLDSSCGIGNCSCNCLDLSRNGSVGLEDAAILAESWLDCTDPLQPCEYLP
jgi:hypothetical protein